MNERIYLSSPDVGAAEEAAVVRAMRSGWIAPLGPEVDAFENELAEATQRRFAVALSSGTAALHLALLNLGVGPGDVVVTATMTFAATANAIVYTGAEPVFVDCDSTGNIDVALLTSALMDLTSRGRRVAAIVPVDLLGRVADYESIQSIANQYSIPIVADAAESLGASRGGSAAGSFGVAAALSFNGNKIMTTSGGGALVTDDPDMAGRARYLATQARQPVVHYEHRDIGYNYRLSNILAALGRAQLARMPEMIGRRRENRRRYRSLAKRIPGVQIFQVEERSTGRMTTIDNCWLTALVVDPDVSGWSTDELRTYLAKEAIETRPLWKPMHAQPVFSARLSYLNGTSDQIFKSSLAVPSGSSLSAEQLGFVMARIEQFSRDRGLRRPRVRGYKHETPE